MWPAADPLELADASAQLGRPLDCSRLEGLHLRLPDLPVLQQRSHLLRREMLLVVQLVCDRLQLVPQHLIADQVQGLAVDAVVRLLPSLASAADRRACNMTFILM